MKFTSALLSLLAIVSVATAAPSGKAFKLKRQDADAQTSLQLDPSQVMPALANDGQDVPAEGQVPSLTSVNNFINFCLTQPVPLTNGQQIREGSCNPTPMGRILSTDRMPSSKFVFPPNGDASIVENTAFTIEMAIQNLNTGNFVNAQANYYAAPAQVDENGTLNGHSHVVVELLPQGLGQTAPLNPLDFVFFKGLNEEAQNGILVAEVSKGLPAGAYRLSSINTAANHQPALVAVAQHGSLDDGVYFTVVPAGQNNNNNGGDQGQNNDNNDNGGDQGQNNNNGGNAGAGAGNGQCAQTVTVNGGDTCESIANANGTNAAAIIALNPGVINEACTNLQIGATICVA